MVLSILRLFIIIFLFLSAVISLLVSVSSTQAASYMKKIYTQANDEKIKILIVIAIVFAIVCALSIYTGIGIFSTFWHNEIMPVFKYLFLDLF